MKTYTLPPGIYPYLVSPLEDDGSVREAVLARLVDDLIGTGVQGLTPLGSTGEVAFLTPAQRRRIVEVTLASAAGRVPVVPGIAAFSTHDAVEQACTYASMGVAGLVVMRQHAFPVADAGIYDYFAAVAHAVDVPVVLYTNPALLGSDFSLAVLDRLAAVPNIRYIKDATSDTGRILSYTNRFGDRLKVFSASAHIPAFVFMLGGVGWMAGPACVIPHAAQRVYRLVIAGRIDEAMALQRQTWAVNEVFRRFPLAACIKAALQCRGYEVGEPIAPQQPLDAEQVRQIRAALEQVDAAMSAPGAGGA